MGFVVAGWVSPGIYPALRCGRAPGDGTTSERRGQKHHGLVCSWLAVLVNDRLSRAIRSASSPPAGLIAMPAATGQITSATGGDPRPSLIGAEMTLPHHIQGAARRFHGAHPHFQRGHAARLVTSSGSRTGQRSWLPWSASAAGPVHSYSMVPAFHRNRLCGRCEWVRLTAPPDYRQVVAE